MTPKQNRMAAWANQHITFHTFNNCNNSPEETLELLKGVPDSGRHQLGQIDDHPIYGDIPYVASIFVSTTGELTMNVIYFKDLPMTDIEARGYSLAIFVTAFEDFPIK
jgi:hypothetical protein